MFESIIFSILALLVAIPLILASTPDARYETDVMGFTGMVGGHQVNLNGTAQEIYSQIDSLFPDVNTSAILNNPEPSLVHRAAQNEVGGWCIPVPGQDWVMADMGAINDGINYLRNLHGTCNVPGKRCVRVSCSWKAAIWVCNDQSSDINPDCGYIADIANDICTGCNAGGGGDGICGGQEFDSGGWDVIVRWDPSHC